MRHKKNKLIELNTGMQSRHHVMRNLLTSLIKDWKLVTTPKRAFVLKSYADSFFSRLISYSTRYSVASDATRESIRYIKSVVYGEPEGKKVINDLIPLFRSKWRSSSFVSTYKLWYRPWDGVEKILVAFIQ